MPNGIWRNSGSSRYGRPSAKTPKVAVPTGSLRLWRDSGDVSIGAVPLGLEEGRSSSLLARDGRVDAEAQVARQAAR
jgi:hypothetical protein